VWVHEPADAGLTERLAREASIPDWIAGMLVKRGIDDADKLQVWLNPKLASLRDPFLLPDMEAAVERLLLAIERNERITVFGDYDVDGLTSTTLMASVLKMTGAPVEVFLPHRMEEGYGLSPEALQRCLEETQPRLIVTVDCGTSSAEAVRAAAASGVDVIVTDHHEPGSEVAPAVAVINPRCGHDPEAQVLAGVGVAFKLAHALLKRARQLSPPPAWSSFDPRQLLDLVALGTVADLVPLKFENRILVAHGLKYLDRTTRCGLRALIDVAGIDKEIGTYEVGFQLGPRLNAAGRLDSARLSLELLMTGDIALASRHARALDLANRERRAVEKAVVSDLLERVASRLKEKEWHAIVEHDPSWHPGVVGLAATRAVQRFHRPAIVIGADDRDRAKGSGRSVSGFHIADALEACTGFLVKHGGHAMAAGLEIEWDHVDAFRDHFNELARAQLADTPFGPRYEVDGWVDPEKVNDRSLALLARCGPFGMGNPEPLWASRELTWANTPREVGDGHLAGQLKRGPYALEVIGFGLFKAELPKAPLEALFNLRLDRFRGRETIKMHLKELRAAPDGKIAR
jgi:single-stranded-DNA-specific exonuclease